MAAKRTDSGELNVSSPSDMTMFGSDTLVTSNTIEQVNDIPQSAFLAELAFMAEPVTFMIHHGDENDENPVIVGVNGNYRTFHRGMQYTVPRHFVDAMIVKKGTVSTPIHKTPDGEETRLIRVHNVSRYPFQIINEPNLQRGPQWLRNRMNELV